MEGTPAATRGRWARPPRTEPRQPTPSRVEQRRGLRRLPRSPGPDPGALPLAAVWLWLDGQSLPPAAPTGGGADPQPHAAVTPGGAPVALSSAACPRGPRPARAFPQPGDPGRRSPADGPTLRRIQAAACGNGGEPGTQPLEQLLGAWPGKDRRLGA